MAIKVAQFLDVAEGTQANQFSVGGHDEINSLDELPAIYKQLIDEANPVILGLIGNDGRVNQTPMWFDYDGDKWLLNVATHRKKVEWIRNNGKLSGIIVNPANSYHWMSIKATIEREILEDDPAEGDYVTNHLNKIWVKYIGDGDTYQLRDPSFEERRVLFVAKIDRVAVFGKP
jgi:general stress protein 26